MARRNVGGQSPPDPKTSARPDRLQERSAQAATEMMHALEDDDENDAESAFEGEDATDATRIRAAPVADHAKDKGGLHRFDLDASQCLRAALESLIKAQSQLHAVPAKDKQRVAAGAYLIDRAIAEVREKLAALKTR